MTDQRPARAATLVVARESNTYDMPMLENMISQTVHGHPDLDGAQEILDAGVEPLHNPRAYDALHVYRRGGTTAVLYRVRSTLMLISKGSATSRDANGDNAFTSILVEVLEAYKPVDMLLATFSRLVRSPLFSGPLLEACQKHVDTVICREGVMEMTKPTGTFMFQILAICAAADRDAQMTRLALGKLALRRRGQWCWGRVALPFGWRLDDDRRPVVDDDAVPAVRAMLHLLATDTSAQDRLDRLAELGVSSPWQNPARAWLTSAHAPQPPRPDDDDDDEEEEEDDDADDADALLAVGAPGGGASPDPDGCGAPGGPRTVGDTQNPAARVNAWYAQLDTYRTGRYETKFRVPVNVPNLAEYPVVQPEDDGPRHVVVAYDLPLPEGGWAPDHVLDAAAALRRRAQDEYRASGNLGYTGRKLPLLAGRDRQWTGADGRPLVLAGMSHTKGLVYCVRGARPPGRRRDRPLGALAAVVEPAELHGAIRDAAVRALRDGTTARLVDGGAELASLAAGTPVPSRARRRMRLADDLQRAERRLRRASDELLDTDTATPAGTRTAARLRTRCTELEQEIDETAAEIAELDLKPDEPPARDAYDVESDFVAALLAGLGAETGTVPGPVASAFGVLVADLALDPGPLDVGVAFRLRLPSDGQLLLTGPIRATVRNRASKHADADEILAASTARFMTRPETIASLAGTMGREIGEQHRKRIAGELERLGIPRSAALALTRNPVPATRYAVWRAAGGPLCEQGGGRERLLLPRTPDEQRFAQHAARVYLDPAFPNRPWLRQQADREQVLAVLLSAGGTMRRRDAEHALAAAGRSASVLRDLARGEGRVLVLPPGGSCRAEPDCRRPDCARHGDVTLVPCPCGRWASRPLTVPECPAGLLCPDCLRMPVADSPVFPAEYLKVDERWYAAQQQQLCPDAAITRAQRLRRGPDQLWRMRALAAGLPVRSRGVVSRTTRQAVLEHEAALEAWPA